MPSPLLPLKNSPCLQPAPYPSLCLSYGLPVSPSPDARVLQGMGKCLFRNTSHLSEREASSLLCGTGDKTCLEGDRDT